MWRPEKKSQLPAPDYTVPIPGNQILMAFTNLNNMYTNNVTTLDELETQNNVPLPKEDTTTSTADEAIIDDDDDDELEEEMDEEEDLSVDDDLEEEDEEDK